MDSQLRPVIVIIKNYYITVWLLVCHPFRPVATFRNEEAVASSFLVV